MGKAWTREEDQLLLDGVGAFAAGYFCRQIGRSREAIRRRAYHLYGTGGLTRGTYSLQEAARETGYDLKQFLRASLALDQKWKRLSGNGQFMITFAQFTAMSDWLAHDYWCSKLRLYGCVNCGSQRRPPRGMGLCPRDYWRVRRKCKTLMLPSSISPLLELVESLDDPPVGVRLLGERLSKGWGPTIDQIQMLATLTA